MLLTLVILNSRERIDAVKYENENYAKRKIINIII